MKKIFTVLLGLFVGVMFAGNVFGANVENDVANLKKEIEEMKNVSLSKLLNLDVSLDGKFILQGVDKANDGLDKGVNNSGYVLDLKIQKTFENNSKIMAHFKAGQGDALDDDSSVLAYSSINNDASTLKQVEIDEFWFEQPVFDDKVIITLGKLSPTGYFDKNEVASNFLNSAFNNNAAMTLGDNTLAVRLTYKPIELVDITYGYFASNKTLDNFDCDGTNAIEVNFKPIKNGNYRLFHWSSNKEVEKFQDENNSRCGKFGFGASIDQKVVEELGAFARFSWQDPKVCEKMMAWSMGVSLSGSVWSRNEDMFSVACGQIYPSADYAKAQNFTKDCETQTEVYYKLCLTKNISLIPSAQYIIKPLGKNAVNDRNIFTYALKTCISF